jgi:soluble lytic murein transglycosylase
MEEYQDTPLAEQLRQNWLFNLARRSKWTVFLEHYAESPDGRRNACYHGYALYKENHSEAARIAAEKLWLVGASQPDECDPVFKVWRENGDLTPDLAWQRYSLAIKANKQKLATYLVRFLAKKDRQLAASYKKVHTRPAEIKRVNRYKSQSPHVREIVLHGIKRLARYEPKEALKLFTQYEEIHHFDASVGAETFVYIGKHLTYEDDTSDLLENLPIDPRDYPELVEARIRKALRDDDWSLVLILINLLPDKIQHQPGWQYWKARVLANSAEIADRESGGKIFLELSETRTFYGFLSAEIMNLNYNYVDEPSLVSSEEILALEATPGIQRALELLTLGERNRARREWYFTTSQFSNTERRIAARVAVKWGWYKPAIQSLIEAKAWNELEFRFPVAFQDTFISNARVADIPVYWSLAIARQESAFMPDAKSPVGAYGVMQLMPATARLVARKTNTSFKSNKELTDPTLNIQLGSHYLGRMLRRYNNNRVHASAAYNAGPGNVDKWINPSLALDVWIETIPFRETKNYVQNVLMFSAIYGLRMQQPQPLIYDHELKEFKNPQISIADTSI